MVILGVDLSYTRTGLVWLSDDFKVQESGTITIKPGPRRMFRAVQMLQTRIKHGAPCDLCVVEDQAYGAPSRVVVAKLAELQGVLKATLEFLKIDYLLVSPSTVKKHVTGKGTAEKHVVARELKRLHNISFPDDPGYDLSDAAACAAYGVAHLAKKTC